MNNNHSANNRFTNVEQDKLRGGYYTSSEVASWLCSWGIRSQNDQVLEPSCGDGVFLETAAKRFVEIGCSGIDIENNLTGIEIIPEEAERSRTRLGKALGFSIHDSVINSDFFYWWQENEKSRFDVVIGNPPFIRYQTFPEPHRSRAMEIMGKLGLAPNRLTNIWVPFVVASAALLRPNGRLALVLPAELLQVSYASQLRSFLADRFTRIDIVTCNELFFEKAEQEVVLLLADGALGTPSVSNHCHVTLTERHSLAEITNHTASAVLADAQPKTVHHDSEKWLKYFLTEGEIAFMRTIRSSDVATTLDSFVSVDIGVVTGKNDFFVIDYSKILKFDLQEFTTPLISRSAHLKGAIIGSRDWQTLSDNGERVHLLDLKSLSNTDLPDPLSRYIKLGEENGVHIGYKCSIRDPWYVVPSVWIPDGFIFRQIYNFPRIVLNQTNATSTDTIHRMRCRSGEPGWIIANTYTWLTAASAEIEGRSYGGGVLELEPSEAEHLLIPSKLSTDLSLTEIDYLVRNGKLDQVLEENSKIVLIEQMGLSQAECYLLRDIWVKMRNRRLSRGKRKRSILEG